MDNCLLEVLRTGKLITSFFLQVGSLEPFLPDLLMNIFNWSFPIFDISFQRRLVLILIILSRLIFNQGLKILNSLQNEFL